MAKLKSWAKLKSRIGILAKLIDERLSIFLLHQVRNLSVPAKITPATFRANCITGGIVTLNSVACRAAFHSESGQLILAEAMRRRR